MPGNLRLRRAQYLHKVTDANLLLCHQVEQPESGVVSERLKEALDIELSFADQACFIYTA